MTPRVGVITFPGSLDDKDAARAIQLAGGISVALWHAEADLHGVDAVVLPGGFSYGDYLRCGAIAKFSPVMEKLIDAAIAQTGASGPGDMGKVMGVIKSQVAGKADGGTVSGLVKAALNK